MTFCPMTEKAVTEAIRKVAPKSAWDFGNQRYTGRLGYTSTAEFYAKNGVEYTPIDINTNMGAVVGDLNHLVDLPPRDLVINNGTGEHLFDQCSVFRNAHNLAKVAILHVLPFTPWVNHGFYNYNPIVFRDLAAANGYETVFHWLGNREGQFVTITPDEGLYAEKNPPFMPLLRESVPEMSGYFNVVLLMKTSDRPFRVPLQGKYVKDIGDDGVKSAYG